jgi:hypothetical protein
MDDINLHGRKKICHQDMKKDIHLYMTQFKNPRVLVVDPRGIFGDLKIDLDATDTSTNLSKSLQWYLL